MRASGDHERRIVVGVDGSAASRAALAWAAGHSRPLTRARRGPAAG
jgi:hypothetical protein